MSGGERITAFLSSRVGNLGIASLVLVVLEKVIDSDFVCPCQPGYNEVKCACYAIVPFITCTMDPKPKDRGIRGNYLYSTLIALIWLFLFFIDGRYVSCACSHWGGVYTETGALKWCKHNESEIVAFENQQVTLRCITISQFVGFAIALVISLLLLISYCCCRVSVQQIRDIPMMTRN